MNGLPDVWTRELTEDDLFIADTFTPDQPATPAGKAAVYATFKVRHSRKTGQFLPKDAPQDAPNAKTKPPADPGDVIEHDPDFPVKEGFRRVESRSELAEIADTHHVVIPPGWTNVQVSIDPNAEGLRARGVDAKGRVQPRYSPEHQAAASARKFQRVKALERDVPALDDALERDAASDPVAGATMLMRRLGLRPGSTENTRADQQAYGATTLLTDHVRIGADGLVEFDFPSKSGKTTTIGTRDPQVRATVEAHLAGKGKGERLFPDVTDDATNGYIDAQIPGYTNKDLRTLVGTGLARTLTAGKTPKTATEAKKARREIAVQVSEVLGNTPTVALNSYIAPEVWDATGWPL